MLPAFQINELIEEESKNGYEKLNVKIIKKKVLP